MNDKNWRGRRVLILGAARQGTALARYLARRGAQVTLNDRREAADLAEARAALEGLPIRWVLGGHPLSLLEDCDLLCLSGGVPLRLPLVQEALRRGIPLSNDTQIFLEAAPCPTVGITGSAGKTTTTALVGEMAKQARRAGPGRVFVGGNIGDPLINYLDEMTADDLAVLEISSFQLEQMTLSTDVAAVLNITPNHLDRHGTMDAYTAAKARLVRFQSPTGAAVLGRDDPGAWALRSEVRGRLLAFGLRPFADEGTFQRDGWLWLRLDEKESRLLPRKALRLRGDHNVLNALAAFAVGAAAGLPLEAMQQAAEGFRGVPHRLETVRLWRGVRWVNDSIATAPERTAAAIRAFDEPLVLLLGGRDKNLPWDELAALVRQRVDHVVVFGEAADKILAALAAAEGERPYTLARCAGLQEAVERAAAVAAPGDVVLLSPGGTSFDEFADFSERGERFRAWVMALS